MGKKTGYELKIRIRFLEALNQRLEHNIYIYGYNFWKLWIKSLSIISISKAIKNTVALA